MSGNDPVRRAVLLSLLTVLVASVAAVAVKYASDYASIEAIVSIQYLVCLVLGLPRLLRVGISDIRTDYLGLHLIRGFAGVLGFYLFYLSLAHITMVDAVLLRQSAPLTVPVVMLLWEKERMRGAEWWPILIGFAGVLVILRPTGQGLSYWHLAGLLSAISLSISMVATRKLAHTEPAGRILMYYFLVSLVCIAPFSLGDYANLPWQAWLAMLCVGVSIYFALYTYTLAYGMAPASAISPINYLAVVLGGLWGWTIWGQVPDTWSWVGSCLVIVGGLLTIYLSRSPLVQET